MVLGKTKTLISGKSIVRAVPKGQQFITEGTHEAIVSREEFEKAQLVIKSNSHKVLMGHVDFPLKGKVRCGNCRRVMAHNFKQVVPTFWCREGLELVGQTQCTSEIFQVSDCLLYTSASPYMNRSGRRAANCGIACCRVWGSTEK